MGERWRWYVRPDGTVDVVGAADRVPIAGAAVVRLRQALNEASGQLAAAPMTNLAMYRLRAASHRWPE